MSPLHQQFVRNRLLASMAPADYRLIAQNLTAVPLERRKTLVSANEPIGHVFFPEEGVASAVAVADSGQHIEVGLVGREGMVGTALVLGADRIPHEIYVQLPGKGFRIDAADFLDAIEQSAALHGLMLRYAQALTIQTAQTAFSNGFHTIEERLARWLLMCHDRTDGNHLPLTHEFLSTMLGVRRPGVTVALHMLEGAKLIRAKRGNITVLDRAGLEQAAGDAYGIPEVELERLIPDPATQPKAKRAAND